MQWSYFIDASSTVPAFSGARVGLASSLISLPLSVELGDIKEVEILLSSHSELLHGRIKITGFEIDHTERTLFLNLGDFSPKITVLEIHVNGASASASCNLALIPSENLPQAVFVMGSPRSGTTVVGNMVQRGLGIRSHGESHMAQVFKNLMITASEYVEGSPASQNQGTLTWEVSKTYVKALQVQQFRELYSAYYPGTVFIDKTPGIPMLDTLPYLFLAYPNAKVVYCKRRGLENIASRLRKFPDVQFDGHCQQWKQAFAIWRRHKRELNTEILKNKQWFIEIEQYGLLTDAQKTIRGLSAFLDLDEIAFKRMLKYQSTETPQKTSEDGAKALSLESISWTDAEKQTFLRICGDEMERAGYSITESYFL